MGIAQAGQPQAKEKEPAMTSWTQARWANFAEKETSGCGFFHGGAA
jgi:hypothetical protein